MEHVGSGAGPDPTMGREGGQGRREGRPGTWAGRNDRRRWCLASGERSWGWRVGRLATPMGEIWGVGGCPWGMHEWARLKWPDKPFLGTHESSADQD